ncbi:TOMM precursor leader peptide-binding protein [uncultured Lamprocystis sp.]|uniref:TOMM precursor leader peptide-binding protein n=2 Tax=uncultured Lamprocystis sp. TaxID=543132 RepID=UPI0025F4CA30|nr:TOMM precursor leader peptide-binding protein [uncultured Lamprocystis sp.]
MIQHPIFKPHLTPAVIPGEGVLLLSEDGARALHGRLYERLAPLLDGTRDPDDLVGALAAEFEAAHVYYALMLLEKNGHLQEAAPAIPAAVAAFWSGLGLSATAALAALAEQTVQLHEVGEVDAAPLHVALDRLGIRRVEREATLDLVLTDDYQRPALAELNATFHAACKPWLLLKTSGHEPWLGPLYRPDAPGCHACLVKRLARHCATEGFAARALALTEPLLTARAALPATQQLMAELAAIEIAKCLAGAPVTVAGAVVSLDAYGLAMRTHRLLVDPACPVCGQSSAPEQRPVTLVSRKVHFMQDGGHRSVAPEQTLRDYEPLVSPIAGVVSQLAPVHAASGIAHVYVAGHNSVLRLDSLAHLKRGLRNASAGKGVTETQAKASALCEAIERYSGGRQGDETIIAASHCAMRERHGDAVIHPNAVMGYSPRQLAERDAWNAKESKFNRVPEPLDETLPIDWTPVWSLTQARYKYLPTQLLYYASPASADCDRFFAMGCSNGNASGNNLEEAVLQGLFELVERDAVALWWYNRLRRPGVDLASFGEPWLLHLAAYYDGLGRDTWALDVTSDLGIPAFVAVSRLRATDQDRLLFGLGCHLDARIALQRAFAEMNQMLGLAREGQEAGELTIEDDETRHWLTTATLANQPYLAPDDRVAQRCLADFPQDYRGDLLEDITLCRRIIEAKGLELLVLDQTRADVGMPVAKVVVPGLRHFWARFGPGRLYEVPVAMGWLERPLTEDQLNPIPMFF